MSARLWSVPLAALLAGAGLLATAHSARLAADVCHNPSSNAPSCRPTPSPSPPDTSPAPTTTEPPPTTSASAPPSTTPAPSTAPGYPDPGTTGYLGDPAALTVYSAANGQVPAGCTGWTTYLYLRCDQTDLTLDHAWVQGGIYWTGCGTLSLTQSIVEWAPSQSWHDIYAQCSTGLAGATLAVTDSTLRAGATYTGGSDVGGLWTGSDRPMLVTRSLMEGFPQGLDPTGGSVISHSEVYATDGAACSSGTCHGDGLFSQGGGNITYDSDRIVVAVSGTVTAAVFWQDIPCVLTTGEFVENSWLQGGAFTFRNECASVAVTDNVFGGGVYGDAYTASPGVITAWSGNTHPDGTPVPQP